MPDPPEHPYPQFECLRKIQQPFGVDIADVARHRAVDQNLALVAIERHARRLVRISLSVRHHVIDHAFGLARDSIDDVIDANRL